MPDFHIEGDPAAVRSRAAATVEKGQAFFATGEALAAIGTQGWTGRAADHFRERNELEPDRWVEAGNGFVRAGNALTVYAGALADAQASAAWAEREYARGEQVSHDARAAYDADVSAARSRQQSYLSRGIAYDLTIVPFSDPGAGIREGAESTLARARSDLDAAAHLCADQVRAGCADAPAKRHWWESGLAAVGGFLAGAGEAVWDLAELTKYVPGSPFFFYDLSSTMGDLASGRITPEELAAKQRLTLETAQGMWEALKDDPAGFGKNLGKALLDWDTWADDPARALGHLVPDAVAAVFTGGAAAGATRGAKGLTDVVEALGRLGRRGGDLGDLADLGRHADDLGDLGDLGHHGDDLGHLGDTGGLDDAADLGRHLDPAELGAIQDYTGSAYGQLNSWLRSGEHLPGYLDDLSQHLSNGLHHLPTVSGDTMRGAHLPEHVIDGIRPGGTYADEAFMSTSRSAETAERFRDGGNAMFHIAGHSGRDVAGLSSTLGETEVLFDKGTPFHVVDKVLNEHGYWDIFLEER